MKLCPDICGGKQAMIEAIRKNLFNLNLEIWTMTNGIAGFAKDTKGIIGTCLISWNEEDGHFDISYNLGKK